MSRSISIPVVLLVLFLVVPGMTYANHGGGALLQIPPSVRSEGMGRAFIPLEIGAMAAWGNPGALGFVHGLDAAAMRTRLVPDLATGVLLNYQSIVLGATHTEGKVPLILSLGFNHSHLDYGPSGLDFDPYERTRGATFAASAYDVIGVGFGVKRFDAMLGAGSPFGNKFSATAYDYGILLKSPPFPFRSGGESEPISASLTGGVSWLNTGGNIGSDGTPIDPLPKVRYESIGVTLDLFPAPDYLKTSSKWLSKILKDVHVISLSGAIGREKDLLAGEHVIPDSIRVNLSKNRLEGITTHRGAEARILDTLALRIGYLNDESGQIIGETYGWGFSLLGVVGVDYARIPQFRDLEKVVKWGFWVRVPLDASF